MNNMRYSAADKEGLRSVDLMFDAVMKHPYLFIAAVCALLLPLGMAHAAHVDATGVIIEAVIWVLGTLALVVCANPSKNSKINIWLIVSSVLLILIFSLMTAESGAHAAMMFVPVGLWLLQFGLILKHENALDAERVAVLLIFLGIVVRYCYCLKYNCQEMQHDIGSFTGRSGHEAYIMYWYDNGLKLPDFDVTSRWQFYHPPLHHMLMALLMRVFTTLGFSPEWAQEGIQILPMLYSSLAMAVCFRIFTLLKLKGAGLIAAMSVVCFYPTFIIWSGAYNNDMLAALLMLSAVLCTLKWAQKPTLLRILPVALCVGFGMMAKLSAWMVAPAIALVFLWVFVKNIKKPLPFIGQFAAFGAVCAPLGLWWGIRNLIVQDLPITYIPDPGLESMSVADISAVQRLFDFSTPQINYPFEAFKMYEAPYNEYNPFMGLIKTSIFDEFHQPQGFNETASMFVVIAAVLALISVMFLVWMTVKKNSGIDLMTRLFFMVFFLTVIISYYSFCFQFPFVCTENIRYCISIIPVLALALGFGVNEIKAKINSQKH